MDWTHLHLALNHVPVVGTPFLLLLLAWGWWRGSAEVTRLALWWFVGLAVLSIALKFTGDFAGEQAGPKLDPVRAFVERHEQSADQATTAVFLLGLSAALATFLGRRGLLRMRSNLLKHNNLMLRSERRERLEAWAASDSPISHSQY